ncbi:Gfo/Idh/MocA family oxidoreductase [Microtetraspora glauca]|uniref:Gfo/Idh/MocA family oxidoreductase n=1 Tax=Microtetraspora glauca TaxID=1996 RepID=A0ABV3G8Y4_MICGL
MTPYVSGSKLVPNLPKVSEVHGGGTAKAFAAEHRIPAAYTSLAGTLDAERPDLVHVRAPPHLHAAQVVECLRAGAWVWCEKPVCLTLAEHDGWTPSRSGGGPALYGTLLIFHTKTAPSRTSTPAVR